MPKRGVTIIEMLVVIVVIAILVTIALPSLRGAKKRAEDIRRLNTTRQLLVATYAYSGANRQYFPYFGVAGEPEAIPAHEGWSFPPQSRYFTRTQLYWASLLVPTYYDANRDSGINLSVENPSAAEDGQPDSIFRTLFALSTTTSAAPAYWDTDEPPDDLALLRATRTTEMSSPSSKGLIVDLLFDTSQRGAIGSSFTRIGMGDGSAARRQWGLADPQNVVSRPYGAIAWEVLSTRHGLRGRDY